MKIKTLSLILIILLIPVFLFAETKAEARVKFILCDITNFGYSSNPVRTMTDTATPVGEVNLIDSASRLVNIEDIYAYWQINLMKTVPVKLVLTITEDMVNALETTLSENERTMTLPMTVEVVSGKADNTVISGKSSTCVVYEGGAGSPVSGSSLLRISCPLGSETNAGEYKGEITLTLEV